MTKASAIGLSILLFLAGMIATRHVFAQGSTSFAAIEVNIWPEFDRPTVLVIYRITLAPTTQLPAEIRLRIPETAGIPHAVASKQPDGGLINLPYTQEPAGTWSTLVFRATTPELQVEYYDPGLEKDGAERNYKYTWPGDYAVQAFKVEVQQPTGASDMRIKPGMFTPQAGQDGLVYHTLDVGPLEAGQLFEITIHYQKQTDSLSSASVPVEPSGPIEDASSASNGLTVPVVLAILGLGVLLIAGGGLWYWQSGKQEAKPKKTSRARRKSRRGIEAESGSNINGEAVYCHQCGKRAAAGDLFCRACGSALRRG